MGVLRTVAAGIFVLAGTFATFALLPRMHPLLLGAVMVVLLVAATVLFNWGAPLPRTSERSILELRAQGLVQEHPFKAKRAFEVEEFEDEGMHYFLELTDGSVLYLSGQYLYDYEPIADDPELEQPRRFPCTEFTLLVHKEDRDVLGIATAGEPLAPEVMLPHFSERSFALYDDWLSEEWRVLDGATYDAMKQALSSAR